MKTLVKLSSVILFIIFSSTLQAQSLNNTFEGDLPRRAELGFSIKPHGEGGLFDAPQLAVRSVEDGSPASKAGLFEDYIITHVNGTEVTSAIDGDIMLYNLPGNTEVNLTVFRNGKSQNISFKPLSKALENLRNVHTTYGVLYLEDGTPLRTILTKPLDVKGKLPAILLSDWTSPGSVEAPRTINRGWINLVRGIVETTGMIVLRIDKPGVGDSRGSWTDLDFNTTIDYQRKALKQLKERPDVDADKIFIFGESVGSFMAPILAQGENVAGIFVYGGGATTWFERMVNFERKQRELSGKSLSSIDEEMKRIIRFFNYYLVEAKPLEKIFEEYPDLEQVWLNDISHNSKTKHYGRPIAFHQQAQAHNFAQAWVESGAPALVLIGEYDQFETIDGAKTIVNAIDRHRSGEANLIIYPKFNHQLEIYHSPEEAFGGSSEPIVGADLVVTDIRNWLNEILERMK